MSPTIKLFTDQAQGTQMPIIFLSICCKGQLSLNVGAGIRFEFGSRVPIQGKHRRVASSVARAVKIRAKHYQVHEGEL